MASINMALRRDDGSYVVLDAIMSDSDLQPLMTMIQNFLEDNSSKIESPEPALPVSGFAPTLGSFGESVAYTPSNTLTRS